MNFTLNQLRIFREVVNLGGVTKAAEKLNMTQPAVSIQLKNLQEQFDIPLTQIIGRKIQITEFGHRVAFLAENILNDVSALELQTLAFKGLLSGTLKIASVSTGKYIMSRFLQPFLAEHNHLDLHFNVSQREDALNQLEKGEVDFVLVSVKPSHLEVEEEVILPNWLHLVGACNRIGNLDNTALKKYLAETPLILRERGSGTRFSTEKFLENTGNLSKVKLELISTEAAKQAVIAGLGVAALSIYSMRLELIHKELCIIPLKGFPIRNDWRIIWLKNKKLSPVASAFVEFLRKEKTAIRKEHFAWAEKYPK